MNRRGFLAALLGSSMLGGCQNILKQITPQAIPALIQKVAEVTVRVEPALEALEAGAVSLGVLPAAIKAKIDSLLPGVKQFATALANAPSEAAGALDLKGMIGFADQVIQEAESVPAVASAKIGGVSVSVALTAIQVVLGAAAALFSTTPTPVPASGAFRRAGAPLPMPEPVAQNILEAVIAGSPVGPRSGLDRPPALVVRDSAGHELLRAQNSAILR